LTSRAIRRLLKGMRRRLAVSLLLALAALALGLASAAVAIGTVARRGAVRAGPWATSTTVGSAAAGPYERAATAVHALFVLNRSQTVYYRAWIDDAGAPLRAHCAYEVRGRPPAARWWSLTAYGADDYLIPNALGRHSFTQRTAALEPDGSFVVRASAGPQPGNWLPLAGRGRVSFTLRLYNPAPDLAARPAAAALPAITGRCP
jgi:hypothetical protein